ncbi:MAG: ABC transporter ATP-binding protein [Armatimonadetes bacterium]|nr:ABC transporter ATP-binding protein [Armatimonadota bacterium]
MLRVENLHFAFPGFQVLEDISFDVKKGELCALFGPNGSGKTTLLKCVAQLLKYQKGDVYVDEDKINKKSAAELARIISYVPQEHKPPFPYQVKEVVLMGRTPHLGRFFGPSRKDIAVAVRAMDLIGIRYLANRSYTELSGGQRQLVLIARALAQETKVLLLDEPTSNLDFQNQIKIWRIIKKATRNGISALTCTHDPNHVLWFCDRVIVLKDNGIIATGPPDKVLTEETLNEIYDDMCSVKSLDGMKMITPRRADDSAGDESLTPVQANIA